MLLTNAEDKRLDKPEHSGGRGLEELRKAVEYPGLGDLYPRALDAPYVNHCSCIPRALLGAAPAALYDAPTAWHSRDGVSLTRSATSAKALARLPQADDSVIISLADPKEELRAYMLGLKRRKRQEGWAVDVEHVEPDGRDNSVRQRLADSDKLWVAAVFAVVLVVVLFFVIGKRGADRKANPLNVSGSAASRSYNDAAHREFADQFVSKKSHQSTVIAARFLNAKKFRIVVRGDVGADEISYLASMAANRISYEFKTRAAVQVYRQSAAEHRRILVATAVWKDDRFGFVVQFENRNATLE